MKLSDKVNWVNLGFAIIFQFEANCMVPTCTMSSLAPPNNLSIRSAMCQTRAPGKQHTIWRSPSLWQITLSVLRIIESPTTSIYLPFTVCIHTDNQDWVNFYPSTPWEVSVLPELSLGHLHYRLTGVQPQSNFSPATVLMADLLKYVCEYLRH